AAPLGVVEGALDSLHGALDALLAGQAGEALAAQRAAVANAEGDAQVNRRLLALDLAGAFGGVGVSGGGREAQQRGPLARFAQHAPDGLDARLVETAEEAVVMLDPFGAQRRRLTQPLQVVALALVEFVEPALRKDADLRPWSGHAAVLSW